MSRITGSGMLDAFGSRLSVWFQIPSRSALKHILYGVFIGFYLSVTSRALFQYYERKKRRRELLVSKDDFGPIELRKDDVLNGVVGLIGMSECDFFSPGCTDILQETHR